MERMKHTGDYELDEINMLEQECADLEEDNKRLEEENKELKEHKENLIRADKKKSDHIDELEKEINELKRCRSIEIETCNRYREKCEGLEEENKKLNEEVRFLEECLDRKEKLNEKYRKEIEKLKSTYVYDAKQVRDIC